MWNAALLATTEDAATAVLTLCEGIDEKDLLASRLTRREVTRQIAVAADALCGLGPTARSTLPEIDWDAWQLTIDRLAECGPDADESLWFAVSSLVPATMLWLRLYRRERPDLFAFSA